MVSRTIRHGLPDSPVPAERDRRFTGEQRTQRGQHLVHRRRSAEQVLVVPTDRAERVGDQIGERDVVDAGGRIDAEQRAQEVAGRTEPGERVGDGTVDEVVGGVEGGVRARQVDELVVAGRATGGDVDVVQGERELRTELVVEPDADVHRSELHRAGGEQAWGAEGGVGADQRLDADLGDRADGTGGGVETEHVEAAADRDPGAGGVVDLRPGDEDRVPAGTGVDAQAGQDRHVADGEAHRVAFGFRIPADQAGEFGEPRVAASVRTEHLLDPVDERDGPDGRQVGERQFGDVLDLAQPEDPGEPGDVAERVVVQVERRGLRPHQADDELEDVGTDGGEVVDVERPRGGTGRARDLQVDEIECELDTVGSVRRYPDAHAGPAEMGHAGRGGGGRERGVELDADLAALVPDQQPRRVGTGRGPFVAGAVRHLHERHMEPTGDEGRRRSGRVVDPDADAYRAREGLHHRRHDDRRIVVGEQRDPPHVAGAPSGGRAQCVVDEVEQRSSLVGIREHVLQAVRVARPAGRVAEPGGVRAGGGREPERPREAAERPEIVLGDGHR